MPASARRLAGPVLECRGVRKRFGDLEAEGTRAELVALVGEHDRVQFDGIGDLYSAASACRDIAAVRAASVRDGGLDLIVDGARGPLPELMSAMEGAGVAVKAVQVDEPELEAVFLHLTGRALRD